MNELLLIILLFITPILLLASYLMVFNNGDFFKIFVTHTVVLLIYVILITLILGFLGLQGGYGLRTIFAVIFAMTCHVILGFAHACYITFKQQPVK